MHAKNDANLAKAINKCNEESFDFMACEIK
jgi:hypothetical protein